METRHVGVLLNRRLYEGIRKGTTGHEVLSLYEESGKAYGVKPCYMQLKHIRLDEGKTMAYVRTEDAYELMEIALPPVIHNRAIYRKPGAARKLERMVQSGIQLFNHCNRYPKLTIQHILMKDEELRLSLPETERATVSAIRRMMGRHTSLIIKPNRGSIGRGIMKLQLNETDGVWVLTARSKAKTKRATQTTRSVSQAWIRRSVGSRKLPRRLRQTLSKQDYLVQQRLPLATYYGRPFDFRVSVQRDHSGSWQVTGIIGKAAAEHSFLTNVAQGGEVVPLEAVIRAHPQLTAEEVRERLTAFSLRVADQLSRHLPELADIGLDVGITEDGFPMFIECNGRDLRYSFLRGGLFEEWINTYKNPMGYAAYLLARS